jgi:hypothetical protein
LGIWGFVYVRACLFDAYLERHKVRIFAPPQPQNKYPNPQINK